MTRLPVILLLVTAFACGGGAPAAETRSGGGERLAAIRGAIRSGEREVRLVCFGDSVTGLYYHTGGRRTYTDMLGIALERLHPGAKVKMHNAGISGHTTENALARIDRDVLAHEPDLVTVMFGLNDMVRVPVENYRANLVEIVSRCRAAGAEVVLATPNAVITTEARPVETLVRYCDVVREVAAAEGVPLCDSFAGFEAMRERDPDAWRLSLSDEIHPNMAGHKVIAEQFARVIAGGEVSLDSVGPPELALRKTMEHLRGKQVLRVLAMPPADEAFASALRGIAEDARLELTPWPVEGMSRYEIRKDASHRVRKMKPDLVVIAVPRDAAFEDREEFIHSQAWIANYAQSFGKQEWDVVVVHPDVFEPGGPPEQDDLVRTVTAGQDLGLVDREPGDARDGAALIGEWVERQAGFTGAR